MANRTYFADALPADVAVASINEKLGNTTKGLNRDDTRRSLDETAASGLGDSSTLASSKGRKRSMPESLLAVNCSRSSL